MKKIIAMTLCLQMNSLAWATPPSAVERAVMHIAELDVKPGNHRHYDDIANGHISAAVERESGTLAMYSFRRKDELNQTYRVEIFKDKAAYSQHLQSPPYQAFIANAPELIAHKRQTTLIPQFLGDKPITQNESTINNLVIVDVKPEFQTAFKQIVLPEMADSLRLEDGVLAMYAATDAENENRWYFYEIYASDADYQRHRQTAHFRGYITQTAEMTSGKEAIPVAPVVLKNKGAMRFDARHAG